jgi:hypothetical protein
MVASKPSCEHMREHACPLKQRRSNKKEAQARELEAMRGWWWFFVIQPNKCLQLCP